MKCGSEGTSIASVFVSKKCPNTILEEESHDGVSNVDSWGGHPRPKGILVNISRALVLTGHPVTLTWSQQVAPDFTATGKVQGDLVNTSILHIKYHTCLFH